MRHEPLGYSYAVQVRTEKFPEWFTVTAWCPEDENGREIMQYTLDLIRLDDVYDELRLVRKFVSIQEVKQSDVNGL